MALTRKKFIESDDLKKEKVYLPEYGKDEHGNDEHVWVKEMSGYQRIEYNNYVESLKKKNKGEVSPDIMLDVMGKLVVLTCRDDEDNAIFTEEDIQIMKSKSTQVLSRIGETALRISGVTTQAIEEAKNTLKNVQS